MTDTPTDGPPNAPAPATATPEPDLDLLRAEGAGLLREMVRIRRFEERCVELYSATRIRGFLHLYIGQEAVAVGVMRALGPDDAVVATYREHGHALARGIPARSIMAEMFGKEAGVSRGRGGSMHLFDATARFYGGNAIVGGGLPVAVGLALADRMRGLDRVTACFFGEGAVAEGEFHESMNLAALWHLPVLFCCENNLYAMGTALERSRVRALAGAQGGVLRDARLDRPTAWTCWRCGGRRPPRPTRSATAEAPTSSSCRPTGSGPTPCTTPSSTATRPRSSAGGERDPIDALVERLTAAGLLAEGDLEAIEADVAAEVDEAVAYAEPAAEEPVEHLTRFVTSERARP